MHFSFYVPAHLPFWSEHLVHQTVVDSYDRLAREGLTLEVKPFYCEPAIATPLFMRALPKNLRRHAHAPFDPASPDLPKILVRFSAHCKPRKDVDLNASVDEKHPDLKIRDLIFTDFQAHFWETIRLFWIAANVASPGVFRCGASLLVVDGKFVSHTESFVHRLEEALEYCLENGWPKVEQLNFTTTWNWVCMQPGFVQGLSQGKISRALNAFTYLFGETYSNIEERDLIWSMIGLEALFSDNAQGVLHQMAEKSALLIGKGENQHKLIQEIYNYRSRLLHGDVDVPNKFSELEMDGEGAKLFDRSYKANVVSCAILVTCLQQIAKRKLANIQFAYRLLPK